MNFPGNMTLGLPDELEFQPSVPVVPRSKRSYAWHAAFAAYCVASSPWGKYPIDVKGAKAFADRAHHELLQLDKPAKRSKKGTK